MGNLEHPDITSALRTGYPLGTPPMPKCPVCGEECSTFYIDYFGEVVGCNDCISTSDACEYEEE